MSRALPLRELCRKVTSEAVLDEMVPAMMQRFEPRTTPAATRGVHLSNRFQSTCELHAKKQLHHAESCAIGLTAWADRMVEQCCEAVAARERGGQPPGATRLTTSSSMVNLDVFVYFQALKQLPVYGHVRSIAAQLMEPGRRSSSGDCIDLKTCVFLGMDHPELSQYGTAFPLADVYSLSFVCKVLADPARWSLGSGAPVVRPRAWLLSDAWSGPRTAVDVASVARPPEEGHSNVVSHIPYLMHQAWADHDNVALCRYLIAQEFFLGRQLRTM